MSDSHEVIFSNLAILMGRHQGLDLTDEQLFLLLNIEASLPEILAQAVRSPVILPPEAIAKLLKTRFRPSLEAADGEPGANGEFLTKLLEFLQQLLPLILPLFVKRSK
jgi:hypothetical protein